jgi:hypothetical protein
MPAFAPFEVDQLLVPFADDEHRRLRRYRYLDYLAHTSHQFSISGRCGGALLCALADALPLGLHAILQTTNGLLEVPVSLLNLLPSLEPERPQMRR